jgi:hypothetical protein
MAEWLPSLLLDGDRPGALGINDIFNGGRDAVNAIARNDLRRGAVNRFLAPIVIPAGNPKALAWNGPGTHTYSDAALGAAIRYTTFGADGNTDRTLIGSSGTGAVNPPDAVVTFDGAGYKVGNTGSGAAKIGWILALFNVALEDIVDPNDDVRAVFCLQYKCDASATWRGIAKSERVFSLDNHRRSAAAGDDLFLDAPLMAAITATTLTSDGFDVNTARVTGVRAMCTISGGTAGNSVLHLGSFRLSAVPILSTMTVT